MALYLATTVLACAAAILTTSMLSGQPDSLGDGFEPVLLRR